MVCSISSVFLCSFLSSLLFCVWWYRHESAHKCSSTEVKGRMTISNGHLGTSAQQITVTVSNTSTAAEIVKEAMTLFGMNV